MADLQKYLDMLRDIYAVSAELGIKSFIWGGFAVDILYGKPTREHSDLDCFTENLVENIGVLESRYESLGYTIRYSEDFWMLRILKDGVETTFNTVRNVDGIAHWHHAGPHGTVFFPFEWLDGKPSSFCSVPAYTCGVRLAYALKTNPRLLRAEWETRPKDQADIEVLEEIIASRGIDKEDIKRKVWGHTPYWYAKGYPEYYYPIILT